MSKAQSMKSQPFFNVLIWLNIFIQCSFPLVYSLTPSLAIAAEMRGALNGNNTSITRVYTLGTGETASSVAKKYNMTPDALRKLNQFRTFAHGFDEVQTGDEIDVPVPFVANNVQIESDGDATDQERQQSLSDMASQAGGFLKNNPNGDVVKDQARGLVSGEAGQQIQRWLSQFGTARVSLDSDRHFSLKNSQLDLLIPFYDQQDNVGFTQGSLHRKDNRSQANLGLGIRHFSQRYMLGGNIFGDYDLSRDHARVGAGFEYWRDYLKLGANSYMRLTNWKDSSDIKGYEERPANGWDIRSEAWIPAYPQLGAKLTYEQYYGQEVALFGKDNRQSNPHAVTAGINYTPIPLLTVNIDQQMGASGISDTRFGVAITYQPGVPWQRQLDPAAVATMRKLTGSRYDLVDRNNNIVLEYRKKAAIRLRAVDLIIGSAGERKSLGVSVNSAYGLSHIDWSAPSLIAAGGQIVQNGKDYDVVLPPYQYSAGSLNNYMVSGVATDTKGNRSNQTQTQVAVQMPELNMSYSKLSPSKSVLAADGKSTQVLKLELRDNQNHPVDIPASDITIDKGTLNSASVSAANKTSVGVYLITVTAGTVTETAILKPSVHGVTLPAAEVDIRSIMPAAENSTITLDKATYETGEAMVATVTLKDANGNALSDFATILNGSTVTVGGGVQKSKTMWSEKGNGIYTATYTATQVGDNQRASMRFSNWSSSVSSAAYSIIAATPVAINSRIKVDKATYIVGDDIAVNILLKDTRGNPISGKASLLTDEVVLVTNAIQKPGAGWVDNGDGSYTSQYTTNSAGSGLTATLHLVGWSDTVSSNVYAIKPIPPAMSVSSINVDKSAYARNEDIVVTVTLRSAANVPLPGNADLLDSAVHAPSSVKKSGSGWSDNNNGTYTATYIAVRPTLATNQQFSLDVDWGSSLYSNVFKINADPSIARLSVPGEYHPTINDGFPTTAFKGATFTLELQDGNVTDYDWSSNVTWVHVDSNGVVTFPEDMGTGENIIITGTPKSGTGAPSPLNYTFKLRHWFIFKTDTFVSAKVSDKRCTDEGLDIPLLVSIFPPNIEARGTGFLRAEWGELNTNNYPAAVTFKIHYWAKNQGNVLNTRARFYSAQPIYNYNDEDNNPDYTVCVRNF